MTAVTVYRPAGLRRPRLGRRPTLFAAAGGVATVGLLFAVSPLTGRAEFVVLGWLGGVLGVVSSTWYVEGRRYAVDRIAMAAGTSALVCALLPLGAVLGYTIRKGLALIDLSFFTHSMARIGPADVGGGVYAAVLGTVEQVALASLLSVPLGLLAAVYLSEYGRSLLARAIRFFVDVAAGVPSIVAGLFVLAFFVLALHQGFSGFAAALALAVLMLPIVIRTSEEMLALVPRELREASWALGIRRWRTILDVVVPTARNGIVVGVMLAVARVAGETAPLLLTAGDNSFINANPFAGQQASLPTFIFGQARTPYPEQVARAWAGALTLITVVVVLYLAARVLTRRSAEPRRWAPGWPSASRP